MPTARPGARRAGREKTAPAKFTAIGETAGGLPSIKPFAFLEAIARCQRPLGIPELGALLGVPQPTAHRIVRLLEEERLLAREPGTRLFGPGDRMLRLSLSLLATSVRSAPRRAILEDLSKAVGETCNFGVMSGHRLVYLDRVEAAWPFGLRFEPGSRVPLHCTSMGKLFLAFMAPEQRQRLLSAGGLHEYTARTMTDLPTLERELKRIRATAVSIDNQEFLAGVVCVAVPVLGPKGNIAAAVAISAPVARMPLTRALQHVPELRRAAGRIEAMLVEEKREARAQHPAQARAETRASPRTLAKARNGRHS